MNEQATCVVGIDISKRKLDIALLANSKIKSKVFDNTVTGHRELVQWLLERGAEQQRTHICMEATGPYSEAVAIALVESGWHISVVNPARIKGFAQGELARNKTDRADASLLARFCVAMRPSLWAPPPTEWRELRGWVDRLQALKDMHQQESNRLEAHTTTGQASLIKSVQTHLDWLAQQIRMLEHDINDHINRHPELKHDAELLRSIPGIGSTTVAKVLAYAGDVRRFTNAKALAAFIGVTPRQRLSGSSVKGRTMMSRTGHADLRRALYMPGLVARRHNPVLRAFGDRLSTTGLAPKAVVGAVMRKLAHLIYGVIKSGQPFDVSFAGRNLDFQDGI
ncbi:MAG: Transposase [Candidatus Nitrotoga sp. MKT]|nr:MAG: Transposase [Candidatus Nitrotoga sp. MKT]